MVKHYEQIVVGSSLRALLFAFQHQSALLFTTPERPFRFDYLNVEIDLSCLKIPAAQKTLTTFGGEKRVGIPKEMLWEKLLFLLALEGNVPLSNLCNSIRCDDDKIVCSNEYSKIAEFTFDRVYYFGDDHTSGFVKENALEKSRIICYDWVAFNRGGKHEIDYISTGDDLVNEIWFYPSDRIDGTTSVKDACVISKLTQKQTENFDYSETMARFKLIHEMESRGMKGKFNGYGPNGNPKHYKFRTTSLYREKYRPRDGLTPLHSKISTAAESEKSLLCDLPNAIAPYNRFLRRL